MSSNKNSAEWSFQIIFYIFQSSLLGIEVMKLLLWKLCIFLPLSSIVLCQTSHLTALFKAQIISTTWVPGDAIFVGELSQFRCAEKCTFAENACFAFHVTSDGRCFLVKENKNWMEQRPVKDVTFWIKQEAPDSVCDTLMFSKTFGKSRYYFEKTNLKNWNDSAMFCRTHGAKLAQVSTLTERDFLWNMLNSPIDNTGFVFVGGYKDRSDGLPHTQGWTWRGSEEPFIPPFFWFDGEPNNENNNEYCSAFPFHYNRMLDVRMSRSEKFVCECSTL